jgi:hypothetical protein
VFIIKKYFLLLILSLPLSIYAIDEENISVSREIDRAYGITSSLARWDGAIDITYNPTDGLDVPMVKWLENAANQWERVSGIKFNEITTSYNIKKDEGSCPHDNVVSAVWKVFDESGGAIAKATAGPRVCGYNVDTGRQSVVDGAINFGDGNGTWQAQSGMASYYETDPSLTHELGHLIGLGHSNHPKSNMFAGPYNYITYPQDDDVRATQVLYGKSNNFVDRATLSIEWGLAARLESAPLVKSFPQDISYKEPGLYFYDNNDGWRNDREALSVLKEEDLLKGQFLFVGWTDAWTEEESGIEREYTIHLTDIYGISIFTRTTKKSCQNPRLVEGSSWCLFYLYLPASRSIMTLGDQVYDLYITLDNKIIYDSRIEVDRDSEFDYNENPVSTIKVSSVIGSNTSLDFQITATDAESQKMIIKYRPSGIRDLNGDQIADTNIANLVSSGSSVSNNIDFGLQGWHEFFAEVNDDEQRYGRDEDGKILEIVDGVCCAGTGFQTLSRILVHAPAATYPIRSYIVDTNNVYISPPTKDYISAGPTTKIKDASSTSAKISYATTTNNEWGDSNLLLEETYGNHNYKFYSNRLSWGEAEDFAANAGGSLMVVNSSAENDFLKSSLNNLSFVGSATDGGGATYVWLGGNDKAIEGEWRWQDGTSVPLNIGGITYWGNGSGHGSGSEPDNFQNQDCLAIGLEGWPTSAPGSYGSKGQWNDIDCSNKLGFIVEFDKIDNDSSPSGSSNPRTFSEDDFINIVTKIDADTYDIGSEIEFFIALKSKSNSGTKLYFINEDRTLSNWNGAIGRLEPVWTMKEADNLPAYRKVWDFEVVQGQMNKGEHTFFVGYRNSDTDGPIHVHPKGFRVIVE